MQGLHLKIGLCEGQGWSDRWCHTKKVPRYSDQETWDDSHFRRMLTVVTKREC